MTLGDQTLLVSGGSRGIGRAVVLRAARAGAKVAFCARRLGAESQQVEAEARPFSGEVMAVAADVRDEASVEQLFAAVNARFGPIDALVNNAGVSRESLLVSTDDARWDEVMDVNVQGTFLMTRRALRDFLGSGRPGRIVSLGSLAEHGTASNATYAASKGAITGFTRSVADAYRKQGIRANVVLAGYVQTELTRALSSESQRALVERCPQQRAAQPEEIAEVVVFLASRNSAAISGRAVHVAGGMREMPF